MADDLVLATVCEAIEDAAAKGKGDVGVAAAVLDALRAIPVEQRMAAMGMVPLRVVPKAEGPVWVEADRG